MSFSDSGHNRSPWRMPEIAFWQIALVLVLVILIIVGFFVWQRVQDAQSEYRAAVAQVEAIQQVATSDEVYSLSAEDMAWLETEFNILNERMHRLQELSELPFGLTGILDELPWVSPRYGAATETLEIGAMLSEAGGTISNIGTDALEALDETGIRYEAGNDEATWLEAIHERETDLLGAVETINAAAVALADIDEQYLPESVRWRLTQMDELLARYSEQLELIEHLPLAYEVLGMDEPRRYLGLFHNPSELRQPGGFTGTIALIEVHRGQMSAYEFRDIYDLTLDYRTNRETPIEAPYAVDRFIQTDGLQIQDANWWAHFPTSAAMVKEMYDVAGWPPIDGVVALQPEIVGDLMQVTGPVDVEVDGEWRHITAENLFEESERQRRLAREGDVRETGHKEVIATIGEEMVNRISDGDRNDLVDAVFILFDGLDRRDMQAWFINDDAQTFAEERDWAGLLQPRPGVPTIGATFANVTGLKTSLAMQPEMELTVSDGDASGMREGTLRIAMTNIGDDAGDPFYEGFQRWWVEVLLPDGAEVHETTPEQAPADDVLNGGGYVIELDPGESIEITLAFRIPVEDQLLVRRQPGLVTMGTNVRYDACDPVLEFELHDDMLLDFSGSCPELVLDEEDEDV